MINRTHNPNNNGGQKIKSGVELGENISVKNGKFGAYIQDNGKNVSLKYSKYFKGLNKSHENLTLEECKKIIKEYNDYKKTSSKKKFNN